VTAGKDEVPLTARSCPAQEDGQVAPSGCFTSKKDPLRGVEKAPLPVGGSVKVLSAKVTQALHEEERLARLEFDRLVRLLPRKTEALYICHVRNEPDIVYLVSNPDT